MKRVTIGFTGDIMLGRLVNEYLDTAPPEYVWGDLLEDLKKTDLNIANLETALTTSDKALAKVFNFRADPSKVATLVKGKIDVVNLANNHILDYGVLGLSESLETLDKAKICHVGAGQNLAAAKEPVIIERKGLKIGVLGLTDNEPAWRAKEDLPGTNFIHINEAELEKLLLDVQSLREKVNVLIVTLHWGPNMRERPNRSFIEFAHTLIDHGVDILHGHSSHIFQGIEEYKKGLILYDTGDFVDDYYVDPLLRNDHTFLFLVDVSEEGYESFRLVPSIISHFQVNQAKGKEKEEILQRMEDLSSEFATSITMAPNVRP